MAGEAVSFWVALLTVNDSGCILFPTISRTYLDCSRRRTSDDGAYCARLERDTRQQPQLPCAACIDTLGFLSTSLVAIEGRWL